MQNETNNQIDNYYPEEGLDIRKYVFKVISNWYWFILALFVGLVIVYFVNRYATERYTVNASMILNDAGDYSGAESILADLVGRRRRFTMVENELYTLKSYTLSRRTLELLDDFNITYVGHGRIRERGLYHTCPFIVIPDPNGNNTTGYPIFVDDANEKTFRLQINENYQIDTVLKFGQAFRYKNFNFTLKRRENLNFGYMKYHFVINNISGMANAYKNKVSISLNNERGTILDISMRETIPERAVDYLNMLLQVYQEFGLEEKNEVSERTMEFIDRQLSSIKDSLEKAEKRMRDFQVENHIYNLGQEGSYIFGQLKNYESEKSMLRLQRSYYEYLLEYLNKEEIKDQIFTPPLMGISDNMLGHLVEQLNVFLADKRMLSYTAYENNIEIKRMDEEIEKIKSALLKTVHNQIQNNEFALEQYEEKINDLEKEIFKLPENESALLSFQREFNINDNLYTYLLEKRAEAGISRATNIPTSKILDRARRENVRKIAPNKHKNYITAIAASLLIPFLIIILLEFFNDKIIEKREIESKTTVPILGAVGHNSGDSEIPVYENPRSSMAEAFRTFRTNLQYFNIGAPSKVICVTSTVSGEGKSFAAINLAAILAMSNKKTLLVSLDLRKPKIHQVFNLENKTGISTFLIRENTFEEIPVQSAIENLYVATSGPIPPNPAELLETKEMADFMEQARKEYDFIVIDTPPLAIVTDAVLAEKLSDIAIFVIRQNYSRRAVLDLVNELYKTKKMKNIGLLINDIRVPGYYGYQHGYSYGYGYSYKYSYRYGGKYYYDKEYYSDEEIDKGVFKRLLKR
ncbi:GumC family protein [Bacteroidota bacterium]